ncbi:MAG: SDR family NAD(P)-dependent oxidoreductase [Hyphomicrobiales bacterium]|nr:MAG: SDR family NAD(P)-dependent oxidoreductase [Hyphomicrobiales bacterium]
MKFNIALTPEHRLDAGIAIAGCRAGECGVLDLGLRDAAAGVASEIRRLASLAGKRGEWGVRWDTQSLESRNADALAEALHSPAPVLVLAGLDLRGGSTARTLAGFRKLSGRILIEAYCLETARAAAALGCDGLLMKGHEAGGRVGPRSSFILLQELRGKIDIPYWIQGGVGLRSAPAAILAGAAGVVLREQLWLTEESPFAAREKELFANCDGSETFLLAARSGPYRFFARSGRRRLRELEAAALEGEACEDLLRSHLSQADAPLVPMGQEIAFAGYLANRYGSAGRILAALRETIEDAVHDAGAQTLLAAGAPLAQMHGTAFSIVQGPMTRVSDVARFAQSVAEAGALPCVALSVLRKPQAEALLTKTRELLGDRPWGVGLLGFAPLELRREQLEAIAAAAPPFAIIGGGRPSQARELETLGVTSYLHAPSPGLLESFLEEGARKFVFEGNECGGHTGPRTSFVLWELAIETLLSAKADPSSIAILFAGGVHDALSAAMVAVMAAPLAARGAKIGVVMGTAYLFTEEIVRTGALAQAFQEEAVACRTTELLQSGLGFYTRCAHTPFCDEFNRVRRELMMQGASREEMIRRLELLNIGRLRIASKGVARAASGEGYVTVDSDTQRREGLFMLGDAAILKTRPTTIAALHRDVSENSMALLAAFAQAPRPRTRGKSDADGDIAIVGMACLLPGAAGVGAYWRNILRRVDAMREVDPARWEAETFYDPRRAVADKVCSKWGGFLDDTPFDPTRYGIPPASLRSIEPMQLLALEVTRRAIEDAGLDRRPFPRERTSAIFGAGGLHDMGIAYVFRTELERYLQRVPGLAEETRREIVDRLRTHELPDWTEDSFPGFLGNVVAGRVANRFDLGGMNFTVDAACASSLAALEIGVRHLRDGDADMAVVGAIDGTNNSVSFMAFAQTHALSPGGRCRPFDDGADGIAIGEGVAVLVLKRLADAERDGDRIRAVIKGIGGSSDGRNKSLTAPHPQGQVAALRRAYRDAAVDPATVELIEAHGTGTAAGDKSEIESLCLAFADDAIARQGCAIGSVKSMIGHAKVVAGLAGVIKSVLALDHKTLPPTLGVETPNRRVDFARTPFYINSETRPWLSSPDHPRRCGVSAFGFGGANFHVVLEEYAGGYRPGDRADLGPRDAELFVFRGRSPADVAEAVAGLERLIAGCAEFDVAALAYAQALARPEASGGAVEDGCRLALLAASPADLSAKLALARDMLAEGRARKHPGGIYIGDGAAAPGSVCFLFPGQGSQRLNMLRDLVVGMPRLHAVFERADALLGDLPQKLSRHIYPIACFSEEARKAQADALDATRIAQPALGAVELAALEALRGFGLTPDFVAGHSYGEYVALCAAGVIGPDELIRLSDLRGRVTAEAGARSPGTMAAVNAGAARVEALLRERGLAVSVANHNAPDQTLIAGAPEAIDAAAPVLREQGLRVARLPIGTAFHSPAMERARVALGKRLEKFSFQPPKIPVFSNATAKPYPETEAEIRALLAQHIREPVRFVDEIENLYEAGARIFVEVGPGQVLSGLVKRILAEKPHAALAIDAPARPGWLQLAHLLAEAAALGCPVDLRAWFEGRGLVASTPERVIEQARAEAEPGPMVWRVNGGRAAPWREAAAMTPANRAEAAPRPAKTSVRAKNEDISQVDDKPSQVDDKPRQPFAGSSQVDQVQQNIAQFIELQREQQETLRRFLDLQSRLLEASGAGAAAVGEAPGLPTLGVPPAPILPRLIPTAPGGEPAAGPSHDASPAKAATPEAMAGTMPPAQPAIAAQRVKDKTEPGAGWATTEQFRADLLRAVSVRTGYPEDMLDPAADMEADLGIDSIKRIEVFSELKDRYDFMAGRDEETVFDELAGLKTLDAIVAWYDGMTSGAPAAEGKAVDPVSLPPSLPEAPPLAPASPSASVDRYVLRAAAAEPLPAGRPPRAMDAPVLLLGPATPVSEALIEALTNDGQQVCRAAPGVETRALGDGRFEVDFSSQASVEELRRLIAVEGVEPTGALISLLGLSSAPDSAARETFLAAKIFEPDLRKAAVAGEAWLVTATALDGRFGLGGGADFAPEAAGAHGVAKSIGREWPGVSVKCLDFDPALSAQAVATAFLAEWRAREDDASLEVGVTPAGRWRLELDRDSRLKPEASELDLDEESVVLVTGGARGVTARVALALAERRRPRLVIVGASAEPAEESDETRGVEDHETLRKTLIRELGKKASGRPKPAQVERALARLLKDREIRSNLSAMRACGAEVEYHALDVRDAEAFGRLLDGLYARWGRIDGVIHGAGVIHDRPTREKSLDSFDAVYETKVSPALALSRKLRPEFLRFIAFFSSVAGRFGNAAQSDYAAANEVLNKLADRLSQEWLHVRVVSINWGPWEGGMANAQILRLMARQDIEPIPLEVGARLCLAELARRPGEAEVVIAATLEKIAAARVRKSATPSENRETAPLDATV